MDNKLLVTRQCSFSEYFAQLSYRQRVVDFAGIKLIANHLVNYQPKVKSKSKCSLSICLHTAPPDAFKRCKLHAQSGLLNILCCLINSYQDVKIPVIVDITIFTHTNTLPFPFTKIVALFFFSKLILSVELVNQSHTLCRCVNKTVVFKLAPHLLYHGSLSLIEKELNLTKLTSCHLE